MEEKEPTSALIVNENSEILEISEFFAIFKESVSSFYLRRNKPDDQQRSCCIIHLNQEWIMPVPDFQTIMLPMLKIAGDGKEHTVLIFLKYLQKNLIFPKKN